MTNATTEHSETHATFVIERTYPSPVKAVWHALSDTQARDRWFGSNAFDATEKSHDFRVGGHGVEDGQWKGGGPRSRFFSTYTDIVDLERMVFTYDLWIDDRHVSTSLTTIAVEPVDDQTRVTYTEQGVHFDGLDSVEGREEGTRGLLDQLGAFLASQR